MKIITAPSVFLVSEPSFHPHPTYALPEHDGPGENIIATAGKVCYDSYGRDGNPVAQHIRTLVNSGHHSVIEHVHVGVFIEGISRGCSHEIVRHRMFNYSQRSTRYTAEGDAAIVLDPYYADLYARADKSNNERFLVDEFVKACEEAIGVYAVQVGRLYDLNPNNLQGRDLRKWCRGKARQLLPHALETRLVMTGNLRAWHHFFIMRSSRHAEAEIRRLAAAVWAVIEPLAPVVFEHLSTSDVDGFSEITEQPRGRP